MFSNSWAEMLEGFAELFKGRRSVIAPPGQDSLDRGQPRGQRPENQAGPFDFAQRGGGRGNTKAGGDEPLLR